MEMTISNDKVERILTDYYRSKEDIKGIVKMKTKKNKLITIQLNMPQQLQQ